MDNEEDCLVHYGVLGMKWGVRKQAPSSSGGSSGSSIVKKISKKISEKREKRNKSKKEKQDFKKEKKILKKPIKKLTDSELKTRIARLELEKKYRDLKKQTSPKAMNLTQDILWQSVKNIGTQAVTYELGTLLNKLANNDIVNPKKGQKDKK